MSFKLIQGLEWLSLGRGHLGQSGKIGNMHFLMAKKTNFSIFMRFVTFYDRKWVVYYVRYSKQTLFVKTKKNHIMFHDMMSKHRGDQNRFFPDSAERKLCKATAMLCDWFLVI